MPTDLAILGAGNMAEAITRGLLHSARMTAGQIIAADISPVRRDLFQNQLHIKTVEDNHTAVKEASTILLSVKPQQAKSALQGIGPHLQPDATIISIMAGISSKFIEDALGAG